MDRGALWAIVHEVAKSQLSKEHSLFSGITYFVECHIMVKVFKSLWLETYIEIFAYNTITSQKI